MPRLTVLMPVYNAEYHLRQAIDSILDQTFTDYEFIIINDGSTDRSETIIASYADPRIRQVNNETNSGMAVSLNKGISLSRGEYIARMDADDISLPMRFMKQVAFMDSHPEIGISGCWVQVFDETGDTSLWTYPQNHEELKCQLFFNSCFGHPSVILRRQVLIQNKLHYDGEYWPAEDYRLWCQLLMVTKGTNLPEVLLKYRRSDVQATTDNVQVAQKADRVRSRLLSELKLTVTTEQQQLCSQLINESWEPKIRFFTRAITLLELISEQNTQEKYFPEPLFTSNLSKFVFFHCLSHASCRLNTYKLYRKSKFFMYRNQINLLLLLKLKLKSLIKQ